VSGPIRRLPLALLALLALLATAALAGRSDAQGLPAVVVSLKSVPAPSSYPADWQTKSSLATLTVVNPDPLPITATVRAEVTLGGFVVGATTPVARQYPAGTSFYETPAIAAWSTLSFTGRVRDSHEQTGRLPDGSYQVCVTLDNIMTSTGQALLPATGCGPFTAYVPKPPSLLMPPNGSTVVSPAPVFQWTPIFGPSGGQPGYYFRLVEILPGQVPLQAIEANRPVLESSVSGTSVLVYPAYAPHLESGRRYAWRVQAINNVFVFNPESPSFNNGSSISSASDPSTIYTFLTKIPGRLALPDPPAGAEGEGIRESAPGRLGAAPAPSHGGAGGGTFADRIVRHNVASWNPDDVRAGHATYRNASSSFGGPEGIAVGALAEADPDAPPTPDGTEPAPTSVPEEPVTEVAQAAGDDTPAGVGPEWMRLHGSFSLMGEAYSRSGSGPATRPDRDARVVTGLSVGLLQDRLQVPVDALISGDQVSFRQNINQIGIRPQLNWAGMRAGNFAPQYATYTLADATLLGGGLELTPNRWRVGFSKGRSREAIMPSPGYFVIPQFERNVTAGHIGLGDPATNLVDFSILEAEDDEESLGGADSSFTITPQRNTVYSVRAQGVLPNRSLRAEVETAFSRFDRDTRADVEDVDGRAIGLKLLRETAMSSAGFSVEYLNGGFMTFGNSTIQGDRLDVGVTGRVQLLQGRLLLDGSAGVRNDDVSDAFALETTRRNAALNSSWQPTPAFGTDVQLSIFSNKSDGQDSSASSKNTSRTIALSPRLQWASGRFRHSLTGSAMLQTSDNSTDGPTPLYDTENQSLLANWTVAPSNAWSVSLSGNYTRTDYEVTTTEQSTFGPGFTWNTPSGRVQGVAQVQFIRSRTGNAGVDTEVAPRLEMRWAFARQQAFVLRAIYRRYQFARPTSPEFNERTASLEYVATL